MEREDAPVYAMSPGSEVKLGSSTGYFYQGEAIPVTRASDNYNAHPLAGRRRHKKSETCLALMAQPSCRV